MFVEWVFEVPEPAVPLLSKNVTVCVFAYNEECRLAQCLENFAGLLEVLVIDNFSTDRTAEIARGSGCRVVSVRNPGFIETAEVIRQVEDAVETDYLIIAFTSDFVPLPLLRKYAEVADRAEFDVVLTYRRPITAGEPMCLAGAPTMPGVGQIRCFRKGCVDYKQNQVHGRGKPQCPPERILSLIRDRSFWFYHIRDYDASGVERVIRGYNDILARQRFDAGTRFGFFRALGSATKIFVSAYVGGRVFRYGMLGFLHCYYLFHMQMSIWLRIWELGVGLDIEGVRKRNAAVRQKLQIAFDRERSAPRGPVVKLK